MQTHPAPVIRTLIPVLNAAAHTPAQAHPSVSTVWARTPLRPPTDGRRALTLKQQALLDYIAKCIVVEHHWPTVKQAARDFVVTTNAITCALKMIEKKGHITRNAWGKPMLSGYTLWAYAPGSNTPVMP